MRRIASMHLRVRQRGAALLILLGLISVIFIYAVVVGLNRSAVDMALERAQKTATALAQAKEALIAYAVTYKDTNSAPGGRPPYTVPGYLPCPDLGSALANMEGTTAGACGAFLVSAMGRLPWRTLGLDALKDGSGECLWYAVSGTYKYSPNGVLSNNATPASPNNLMNWDTNGQFNIMDANGISFLAGSSDETRADTRAVAVIFAPGGVVSGQIRTPVAHTDACGGDPSRPAAYLDTANGINNSTLVTPSSPVSVTDVTSFIAGTSSNTFNDQLVYITRADIWNAIKKRSDFNNNLRALTRRAAECVAMYGTRNGAGANDKRLPWASSVSMSSLDRYAVARRYRDVSGTDAGRLSYRVDVSDTATSNALATNSDLGYSSILLLAPSSYCAYTLEESTWYDNWKDQLFYAVANGYNPLASHPTAGCTNLNCLKISDGINTFTYFAAVVIFAGEKLSGQNRSTLSDKSQISNYLEGSNTNSNSSGNNTYQGAVASSTFNDFVYAIDTNLAVKCYDTVSRTMMAAHTTACP